MKTQEPTPEHSAEECFLTQKELAARHSCSLETLKRRRKKGILPAYHFGRGVRYKLSDVLKYEEQARS